MRRIDIHLSTVLFLFPRLRPPTNAEAKSGQRWSWNASAISRINISMCFEWKSNWDGIVHPEWRRVASPHTHFDGYLLPSCLSASEHSLPPDAAKRKEHILQNWQGLFFLLSELFVKQLFFGGNSLNIKKWGSSSLLFSFFRSWKSLPEAFTLWKIKRR